MADAPGPRLRTDIVDAFLFRRHPDLEFLQLHRSREPLLATWQPVMGHVEEGETAVAAMCREVTEEVGLLKDDPSLLGMWALDQVHPFYVARIDAIVLSPRFIVEVASEWTPRLNDEHDEWRWIPRSEVSDAFVWPGQHVVIQEALDHIIDPPHRLVEVLRLK